MAVLEIIERSWPALHRVTGAHTGIYRASRGRIGHRFPGAPPMLLLDHVGAKSGTERTTPLVYTADGDDLVLVASKGGYPRNPGWYYNLKANPETEVQVGAERRRVRARIATDAERPRLWKLVTRTYGPFDSYQRYTDRQIPLVVLEPA